MEPITGCTKITAGCDNCYAARFAERFRGVAGHPFEQGFDLALRPERISQPLAWRRPRMIFVNSMSDLFHKGVPRLFIDRVFDTMEAADWHVFQVLTKRSPLMRAYLKYRYADRMPPAHLWLGVSVEDFSSKIRIEHLRLSPAAVRFLSVEPLIGPVGPIDLDGIHWVIAGGESGPGAAYAHRLGSRHTQPVCKTRNTILLQAVGWHPAEIWRSRSRRSGMERVAHYNGRARRMTLPPIERYSGREQAYVKHYFLSTYIERLVHKVAGSFTQVVYVDGFSRLRKFGFPAWS